MSEKAPTGDGIYYMLRPDDKLKKAASVFVYRDRMGFLHVKPTHSSGISRPLDNLKGKVLFSTEPITFVFLQTLSDRIREVSSDHPV